MLRCFELLVSSHSERRYQRFAVWFGGSIIASQPQFYSAAHTKAQYAPNPTRSIPPTSAPRVCRCCHCLSPHALRKVRRDWPQHLPKQPSVWRHEIGTVTSTYNQRRPSMNFMPQRTRSPHSHTISCPLVKMNPNLQTKCSPELVLLAHGCASPQPQPIQGIKSSELLP